MSEPPTSTVVVHDVASSGKMPCICGDPECGSSLDVSKLANLSPYTHQHQRRLHGALKEQNCATVCDLLQNGMQFCENGDENCYFLILKHCKASFLDNALMLNPDAINARGPNGATLLMLCESMDKIHVVMKYGPDVNALNKNGDTVLLQFVKFQLSEVVAKISQSFRQLFEDPYFSLDKETNEHKTKVQRIVDDSKAILEFIILSGVDLNARDCTIGSSAIEFVLNLFRNGFVFNNYHYRTPFWDGETEGIHMGRLCFIENDIASHALFQLVQAQAEIPPADDAGCTAMMKVVKSPWNIHSVELMLERGVACDETDHEGHNATYHLLQSFEEHCYEGCIEFQEEKSSECDKILYLLMHNGCELLETNFVMEHSFQCHFGEFNIILHLMTLRDSWMNKQDFPQKKKLKSDPQASFLEIFLLNHQFFVGEDLANSMKLNFNDVECLAQEISQGLDVTHVKGVPWKCTQNTELWQKKLSVPFGLLRTMYMKLTYNSSEPDKYKPNEHKEYYQALDKVLQLLLPFWCHPPMALLVFCIIHDNEYKTHFSQCLEFVQLLNYIGGPLNPGSKLFRRVKHTLEKAAMKSPHFIQVLDLFNDIHDKVPSLQQLSRNTFRANLKQVDAKGLDVSSLKVLYEGERQNLPTHICQLLNFVNTLTEPANIAENHRTLFSTMSIPNF